MARASRPLKHAVRRPITRPLRALAEDERLAALVENLAAQRRLAQAIAAGETVDVAEVNRLVLERERLISQAAA